MSRIVAALYDSRSEAELAGARLVSQLKAKSPRIIGRDTIAAVDDLRISKDDASTYRQGVRDGAHLLAAEVPTGTNAEQVIAVLEGSGEDGLDRDDQQRSDREHGRQVTARSHERSGSRDVQTSKRRPAFAPQKEDARARRDIVIEDEPETETLAPPSGRAPEPSKQTEHVESRARERERELRVGRPQFVGAAARVRSFTHDALAEEQVVLRDEVIAVESRTCDRRLTDSEIEAGGLFKERVFEVAEMREEPVVTKIAVVREEVIVRRTVTNRTETIRDTVRQTEVEVEDLPEFEGNRSSFFREPSSGQAGTKRTGPSPENSVDQMGNASVDEAELDEPGRQPRSSSWF